MKKKSWLTSSWTIGIATTVLGGLLTILIDSLKNKPILSTIDQVFHFIWICIISVLNFNLRVWWLLVGLAVIIIILYFISKDQGEIKPDFYDYKEGILKQWKWTWKWERNSYKKAWEITDMQAHCPRCDTFLIHYTNHFYDSENYNCPRCNFNADSDQCEDEGKIRVLICDNIEKKRASISMQTNSTKKR